MLLETIDQTLNSAGIYILDLPIIPKSDSVVRLDFQGSCRSGAKGAIKSFSRNIDFNNKYGCHWKDIYNFLVIFKKCSCFYT